MSTELTVDANALHGWIERHREQMLADLREYVEVETPSDDKSALDKGLCFLEELLGRRLGEPVGRKRYDGGEHGDILVLDYPGNDAAEPVLALAHYDTVWPLGTLAELPFAVDGDILRGPGIFDMKSGLVQLVWALRAIRELGVGHPPVRLLLNGDEELGSPAARPIIEDYARQAERVWVLEASADGGRLKTARKGVGLFQVHLDGVEAHAGLDPTSGASAVLALGRVIRQLEAGIDLDAGTSINVGIVRGGSRANVTAGSAWASIDVRVSTPDEQWRVDALFAALDPGDERVGLRVTGGWNRPVMDRNEAIAEQFALARDVAGQLGFTVEETAVGGASDGNFAAAVGGGVLDGLGAIGGGAHARDEHATVSGMLQRTALLAGLLAATGN